jgi:hypothetical protein
MSSSASTEYKIYFTPKWPQIEWLRSVQAKLGGTSQAETMRRMMDWAKYKNWPDQQ